MKVAVLATLGNAPVCGDFSEPDLQAREVLVQVRAAAVKQLERLIASGKPYSSPKTLPIVPGLAWTAPQAPDMRAVLMFVTGAH